MKMNKILIIAIYLTFFIYHLSADFIKKEDIPNSILKTIEKRFDNVIFSSFETTFYQKNNCYLIKFDFNGKKISSYFLKDCKLLKIFEEFTIYELNENISKSISSKYSNTLVIDAIKEITDPNKIIFTIKISVKDQLRKIIIEENGNIINDTLLEE